MDSIKEIRTKIIKKSQADNITKKSWITNTTQRITPRTRMG
ncbi:hypothetical protein LEP1GSC168_4056 [Leptospira santarosai str. HAI134]|nr:hypothetical protein LEP1GSC163_1180 [Leptospira santarosai str. CBC379]EMO20819.1 hypothetical protein LEP1GSC168_4056 [Leptospira santarosai str. HAI134]